MKIKKLILQPILLFLPLSASAQPSADWPVAGANSQRTSWTPNEAPGLLKALWVKRIEPYVSVKTQVIGAENKVFLSTAKGVYAFNADNGSQIWVYATQMPISHSPTYYAGTVYAAGLDRKIHAINSSNGTKKWVFDTSLTGGSGFSTNPLVAENTVFAGGRDGFMYAVDATTGLLKWKYHIEGTGPIAFSAAYSNGKIFFGAQDGNAYALFTNGNLAWKTKLPGLGFTSWWPVIYNDKVIFTRYNEERNTSTDISGAPSLGDERDEVIGNSTSIEDGVSPAGKFTDHPIGSQTKVVDIATNPNTSITIPNYFETKYHSRNVFVLNQSNGLEVNFDTDGDGKTDAVPMLKAMPDGSMYPPVVSGFDNTLYFRMPLIESGSFAASMAHGWEYGSRYLSLPVSKDAGQSPDWPADEPTGISGGGKYLYWNLCCDRFLGTVDLSISNTNFPSVSDNRQWRYLSSGGGTGDQVESLPDNYFSMMEAYWWNGNPSNNTFGQEGDNIGPTIYDGKMYIMRSNALLAYAPNGLGKQAPMSDALDPTGGESAGIPSATALKVLLESEVKKIVDTPTHIHLKPGFGNVGNFDSNSRSSLGDNLLDYWHYPGDIHYVLLRALHLLSPDLQEKVKTYLKKEFELYPPSQYGHIGWKDGEFRESYDWPPEMAANIAALGPGNSPWTNVWGWPPQQMYALWLYAKNSLGDPIGIFNTVQNKLPTTAPSIPAHFPQALNAFIAGYKGYVELAKLANKPYATQENILNSLLQQRANNFTTNLVHPDLTSTDGRYYNTLKHAYNFMYMTPELGTYLNQNAKAKVQGAVNSYTMQVPFWSESLNREVFGENGSSPYQQTHALFQAKALILKEPYNELAKYLDAPMMLGDLYYIDNLVAAIESACTVNCPTPPPASTPTKTPTPGTSKPGDANGDGQVNGADYLIWISHYGQSVSGPANGDFNNDSAVNGQDYIIWLANYGT